MTDIMPVEVSIRGPIKISNSELQTFKDCRRKWWLNYYRRLQPQTTNYTGALALGSRIHEALDMYYSTDVPLLEAHSQLVQKDKHTLLEQFRDTMDLDSEAELGRIMLEGYLDWVNENGIDAELEMISTEEIISMPMLDGKVELQGKLDMRVRRKADGVRMFRDFKTVGGSFTEFAALAHMNAEAGGPTPLSPEGLASAVWDTVLADHQEIGSTGKALNDAGSAGNPWSADLASNNTSGTFGYLVQKLLTVAKFLGLK